MKTFKRALSVLLVVCMLLSCIPAMSVAAVGTAGTTAIQDLEVDQRTTPMGIDNTTPEFRWEMTSDVRGQKQTAYQIVVKNGDTTVWDSGKVESDVSNAIPYAGTALESSTRYTWTVTVWDKDGKELDSQSSWFEMGLLHQAEDWAGASFIAPNSGKEDSASATQYVIDFDFVIDSDNQGFCFGMKDSGTFVMWQVSSFEGPDTGMGDVVLLRPHFKSGGAWAGYPGMAGSTVKAVDITEAIGYKASEIEGKQIHERIVVDGANIKTYFGSASATADTDISELKLADDYTYTSTVPFNGVGFRQGNDGPGHSQEITRYDNIIVKDFSGNVLYTNDFSDASKPGFEQASAAGEIGVVDGWLKVGSSQPVSEQIYVQKKADMAGNSAPMFRKDFEVKDGLVSARLYATSLGIYEAYINGSKVGDQKMAPGWTNYSDYIQYQTYDVTDMLKAGDNAIGAIVGNGWYSGHVSTYGGVHKYGVDNAFIGKLVLTYADGTTQEVPTDTSWQSYTDGPYVETCNQNGETYDARKEVPGWANAGFDTTDWLTTKVATKQTINTKVDTTKVALVAQPEDPARVIEELPVKFLAKTGEDTYVYDIGQNISGILRINVKGEAGTTLKLRHGEMVYKDTNVLYTANLREAKATDYYTLKGDVNGETYEPSFTFHGFRYFEVSGLGYQPDPADITALVVHSELDRTGWVTTNNDLVNQLFSNVIWGQRDNYLSIPTDCPQRDERLGWTGDATTFSRTGSMNFDIDAFYTKFMRNVENARNKTTGAIYDIAPREGHAVGEGNHGWGDVAVVAPWTMFTAYADTGLLEENWTMMTEWIKYYVNKAGDDLLLPADSYGDWLAVETSPKEVTATSYFAYSTSLMAKMATALGKTEEAKYYNDLFEKIRTAYVDAYVNTATGVIEGNTQTIYVMALYFNLIEDSALRQKVAENLVSRIEAANWHLSTGFLGCELLLPALTEAGYTEIAYQLLLNTTYPSWLYPVVNGATTIWERWNSYIAETGTFGDVGMNSFNHYSYGSVTEWFYQYAAGIQYDWQNPGYKHFTIAPNPSTQLNQFKAEYESVYGRIVSDWALNGEAYTLNVTVPANTTATVVVPSELESALTVDGQAATAAVEGVKYVGTENGKATFEVESGSYAFTSKISQKTMVSTGTDASCAGKVLAAYTINGSKSSFATVPVGQEVTVSAAPLNTTEWAFEKWTGAVESTENPMTVRVDGITNLYAVYTYIGRENLALDKTVSTTNNGANSEQWRPGNLTDGNYVQNGSINGWTTGAIDKDDCNVSIKINLYATADIDEVHLYPRTDSLTADGKPAAFPRDFTIDLSSDGKQWTTVATYTDVEAPEVGDFFTAKFDAVNAQFIRINVTKANETAADDTVDRIQLCEVGVYGSNFIAIEFAAREIDMAEFDTSNFYAPNNIDYEQMDDCIRFTVKGGDPYIHMQVSSVIGDIDAEAYPYLVLAYKTPETNSSSASGGQVFYGAGATKGASEENSVKFDVTNGDEWTGIIMAMTNSGWAGSPNFLRLDPFNGGAVGDYMDVKAFYLTHTREQAQAIVDSLNKTNEVALSITGDEQVTLEQDEVTFTVSVSNTNKLATATLELALDTKTMAEPTVEGLNGWYVIAQTYANGKLNVVMGNNAGVSGEAASDMLKLTAKLTGKAGSASVEITSAELSGYTDDAESFVPAILGENAKVVTEVTYSIYDVNQDGVINQLDITRAQRAYGASEGDATWNPLADVNDDGTVDINDLILIINHFTVAF